MPYKDKQKEKDHKKEYHQKSEVRERIKKYRQRSEVKAKHRERNRKYSQRPEVKERRQKPEYKANQKEYRQRPERKERERELRQKPEFKAKEKKYLQRPEVKKRKKENSIEYRKKPEVKKRKREWIKNKLKIDKEWAITQRLRSRLRQVLRIYTKTGKITTAKSYGVNFKAIIEHLKPFPADRSKYHVDHIKPLCSFNLENHEEIRKAFAPENHQWLTIQENLVKGRRY